MNSQQITNLCILFFILIVLGFLHKKYEDKLLTKVKSSEYESIQNFLLDDVTLGKSKKPILWIHVPYEYNSRNWLSFGSRTSFNLNQPYLFLTVRSIIKHCEDSFTICIFDDNSYKKLIPGWDIDMSRLTEPIISNIRTLGMMRLLYIYGGMLCPISFLCMKNLHGLFEKGTRGNKMFICETTDRNSTSVRQNFYPSISFCGARKNCETINKLCNYIQTISSVDHTAESKFLGQYDTWLLKHVQDGKINLIEGVEIGTKTLHEEPIILDDLMSNNYLDLYDQTFGILIPADELLSRNHFGWFVKMSAKEVLESDTIIGNYLLLSVGPKKDQGILEPLEVKPNWVSFWKTPLINGLYGLKPNFLGDNLNKSSHPGR